MKKRKKILIIFPDAHLAYSPTTLQLSEELNKVFDCYIFCFETSNYHKVKESKIFYAKRLFGVGKLFMLLKKFFPTIFKFNANFYYKKIQLRPHLLFNKYDEYIYVDPISIMLAGSLYKTGTLLSLELTENTTHYLPFYKKISHLIIQNEIRKQIYFDDLECETFYIQNSPNFIKFQIEGYLPKKKNQLVFGGSALLGFGIETCLNFVKTNTKYDLVIKGSVPKSINKLINSIYSNELKLEKIIVKNTYQKNEEYLIELSESYVGFAFYDTTIEGMNQPNFVTGPSGKMFKYFAAGVPVVASNLPGFSPIKEFDSGILIDDLTNENIFEAIKKIENNYNYYQENCYKAAEYFSFDNASVPYVRSLKLKLKVK